MKRKFTFLIAAALMLLTMMATTGTMWGQTRTDQTAFYGFESGDAGWTATTFVTNNTAITAHGGSKYGATNGTTADVKYNSIVATPLSLTCYYSKTTTNTNASSKFTIQVSSNGTTWTTVATGLGMDKVTKGTWYELSADLSSYSNVYVRVHYDGTTGVRALDDITLTYDDGQSPSTDPVISFNPASVTLDDVLVNNEASTTFTVSQSNLDAGITLSVNNGELSQYSIDKDADPTSIIWTYTPTAAGAISATVTATSGETSQTLEISGTAIAPVEGYDVDFEYATNMYPNWTFTNMTTQQNSDITAHGGTYYGTTGGKETASLTTSDKVENPGTLTCYVSKASNNTNSSTWYIQVSTDGSSWTNVNSQDATSMSKGTWVKFTADLSNYSNVYVRIYYNGSTAVRTIDDLTLTTAAPSNIFTVTYNANGATSGTVPVDETQYDSDNNTVTVLGNTDNLAKAGYIWAGWNTKADGTGTDRAAGSTFNISENTTLYAKWDAKTITTLTYSGTPTATQYAGQAFNPAGLTVTATFNDASQEDVTSQVVWTPNQLTIETTSVTGTYMGLSVVVKGITVTYAPGTQDNPYTVAQARAAIDAGTGVTEVYATGIVSEIVTEYSTQWSNITFDIVDESGDAVSLRAYRCGGDDAANVQVNDIAVIYGNLTQYGEIYEFASGCQLVSLEHPIVTEPTITVTPATVNVSAEGEEGTLTVTYDNINEVVADVYFCDAQGGTATYDWITAEINSDKNVYYIIDANDGEARTAYLKVYALDDNAENVYSNLVTINQDEYVAPTYATLPFSFDGGIENIAKTDGLYQEGLGSDYGSSPKLKFDGTGDWLLLQFQERPGTLTFNIKGNSFSGGTFTVQTSEDDVTYTSLATYTELGNTQNEEFDNLGENVRYIKWIYTKKSSGNVGLGKIALTKYVAPVPAITVESTSIAATAEETQGTLNVTYTAIETDLGASIYWFESDSETPATEPDWISADINETTLNVDYIIGENDGEARTAYFKVCGSDSETNLVYSELVTVTQAAYVPTTTYTLATSIESGLHYIITNGTNKAMGVQNNNNRAAVAITIENYATTITEDAGVYEIVINGPDANGKYTIYDKQYPGYLYAASSSSNHLKTRESNSDGDSQWTIEFETAGNVIITATGNNTRNLMRYNDGSTCFSCYTNNSQQNIYLYVKENDTDYEYYGTEINYTATSVPDGGSLTVGDGTVMTVPNNFENTDPTALIIEEGGQLIHPSDVQATVQKSVAAYTAKDGDGWYLIASPVDELSTSGLITEPATSYDLFAYNEATAYWWSNTGGHDFSILSRGQGYLYANANSIDLDFAGLMIGTGTEVTKTLSFAYDGGGDLKGYNLMGNPFSRNLGEGDMTVGSTAVTMYYGFNDAREEFETKTIASTPIKPGQGFFIQATEAGQQLVFHPATSKDASDFKYISISAGDENFTDKAYIQFGYGNTLRKMTFGENTMVYVMNDDLDYAAARVEELAGTIPVHFVPIADGFYTITVETKNIENLNYMHLIDNITNTDIDLLAEPSYTFKASESDNADRFYLVFDFNNYTNVEESFENSHFAYQFGDELILNGNGTLQVFDIMGRFVMSREINGSERISTTALNAGVYVLRLNDNIQKIVVR